MVIAVINIARQLRQLGKMELEIELEFLAVLSETNEDSAGF